MHAVWLPPPDTLIPYHHPIPRPHRLTMQISPAQSGADAMITGDSRGVAAHAAAIAASDSHPAAVAPRAAPTRGGGGSTAADEAAIAESLVLEARGYMDAVCRSLLAVCGGTARSGPSAGGGEGGARGRGGGKGTPVPHVHGGAATAAAAAAVMSPNGAIDLVILLAKIVRRVNGVASAALVARPHSRPVSTVLAHQRAHSVLEWAHDFLSGPRVEGADSPFSASDTVREARPSAAQHHLPDVVATTVILLQQLAGCITRDCTDLLGLRDWLFASRNELESLLPAEQPSGRTVSVVAPAASTPVADSTT